MKNEKAFLRDELVPDLLVTISINLRTDFQMFEIKYLINTMSYTFTASLLKQRENDKERRLIVFEAFFAREMFPRICLEKAKKRWINGKSNFLITLMITNFLALISL